MRNDPSSLASQPPQEGGKKGRRKSPAQRAEDRRIRRLARWATGPTQGIIAAVKAAIKTREEKRGQTAVQSQQSAQVGSASRPGESDNKPRGYKPGRQRGEALRHVRHRPDDLRCRGILPPAAVDPTALALAVAAHLEECAYREATRAQRGGGRVIIRGGRMIEVFT